MQAAGVKLVQVSESQADTAAKILTFVKKWKLTELRYIRMDFFVYFYIWN